MKLFLADGPYIRLNEGNLSEEFQRTLEIDCEFLFVCLFVYLERFSLSSN